MNSLCNLKGHMWYYTNRIDIEKEDGLYSVATKKQCVRCRQTEELDYETI